MLAYELELMLVVNKGEDPAGLCGYAAAKALLTRWFAAGVVEHRSMHVDFALDAVPYQLTRKGRAWLTAILSTPVPVERVQYVGADGNPIEEEA